ncbi:SRPBCC domain-containing protein [Brevibacterium sp. RIT 803]|uniref:SRPBCC family protein n=1 Tax=Brevibacterium sp. RIT 803 TaxID=2810210 RepID=UPI00194F9663|nr:SRPBCC domain-containing protein [Brevibacterium sp. RIT 803]MBM6591163.1 SRPBCC domain-containing protein [Brevibacterium sp. RIT 803]
MNKNHSTADAGTVSPIPATGEPGFTIVRDFAAPRERVWDAWTNPDVMACWYHPEGLHTPRDSVSVDLREGGIYAYTMIVDDTGVEFATGGRYRHVESPRRLDFTWGNQGEEDSSPLVSIEFDEIDATTTRMTFTLTGLPNDSGAVASVYDGWNSAFNVLEAEVFGAVG